MGSGGLGGRCFLLVVSFPRVVVFGWKVSEVALKGSS